MAWASRRRSRRLRLGGPTPSRATASCSMSRSTEACCSSGKASASRSWLARKGRGQDAVDPGPHPVLRLAARGHAVLQVTEEPPPAVVEQEQQQLVLGLEVAVEGLGRQSGLAEDVAERGIEGPCPLDQPVGRLDDALHLLHVLDAPVGHRTRQGPLGQRVGESFHGDFLRTAGDRHPGSGPRFGPAQHTALEP
jgi:hypothetical protein